jgi:hypothetical protein
MSKIYNPEIKERFLNTIDLSKYPPGWWNRVFEKAKTYEEYLGKDLHSFTTSEILEFYRLFEIKTLSPLIVYNTNLIKYGQWAYMEHLIVDGQNHYEEINNEMLLQCTSKLRLQKSLLVNGMFDEFMSKVFNYQDKYILQSLYEGIKGKEYTEITSLKLSDIDSNGIAHLCTGRNIEVSDKFIDICEKADSQRTYMQLNGMGREYKLLSSIYIFKQKDQGRNAKLSRIGVYKNIRRIIYYIDAHYDSVTSKSIKDSGFIDHLNERADKYNISVEQLLDNPSLCEDLINKYDFNIMVRKRFCMEYSDYLH